MDTLDAILARRSVREYLPEPLPDADLRQILEAGRQAPSAANRQPWHFVVVREPAQRKALAAACSDQHWMANAAAIIVAIGLPTVSQKWYRVDVAIALENMVLAAAGLGYGTCWIGAFDAGQVRAVCGIPHELDVVACTPLGRPAAVPAARPRRRIDEVFSGERYGEPLS